MPALPPQLWAASLQPKTPLTASGREGGLEAVSREPGDLPSRGSPEQPGGVPRWEAEMRDDTRRSFRPPQRRAARVGSGGSHGA